MSQVIPFLNLNQYRIYGLRKGVIFLDFHQQLLVPRYDVALSACTCITANPQHRKETQDDCQRGSRKVLAESSVTTSTPVNSQDTIKLFSRMAASISFKITAISDPASVRLGHLWVRIELEFCLALDLSPQVLTDAIAHSGHDPAILVNIHAPKLWTVLDQGSPPSVVPNPRLSSALSKLPSHHRSDSRSAFGDIDVRGSSCRKCPERRWVESTGLVPGHVVLWCRLCRVARGIW